MIRTKCELQEQLQYKSFIKMYKRTKCELQEQLQYKSFIKMYQSLCQHINL